MNKKDAYALGAITAMLKVQYGLDDIDVRSDEWADLGLNAAFYKGVNSVVGPDSLDYRNLDWPGEDGVYKVEDPLYERGEIRWARFDSQMGWTNSTNNRASLNAPTLPFVGGRFPWKI